MKADKKCYACLKEQAFTPQSKNYVGRLREEDKEEGENPFAEDKLRLIQSSSFRYLDRKMQVFFRPQSPSVRNRFSHTWEVVFVSRLLASQLGLNVDLVEAIAMGHDIGHPPCGHTGETFLNKISPCGFDHGTFGVVVLDRIENQGLGLNLTYEVLNGIRYHSFKSLEMKINQAVLPEYMVVALADKACYIFSDFYDFVLMGLMTESIEQYLYLYFGRTWMEMIETFVAALVEESYLCGRLTFENTPQARAFRALRQMMFNDLYLKLDNEPVREELRQRLSRVYDLALKYSTFFLDSDPLMTIALANDEEIFYLSEIKGITTGDLRYLSKGPLFERLQAINGDNRPGFNSLPSVFKP